MRHVIALVLELAEPRVASLSFQQSIAQLLERLVYEFALLLEQGIEPALLGYKAQSHRRTSIVWTSSTTLKEESGNAGGVNRFC